MDKGKRPMTVVHALAEERAKKAAYRSTSANLHSISQSQGPDHDPVYQGTPPTSSRPPFPVEPEDVANIVGTQREEPICDIPVRTYGTWLDFFSWFPTRMVEEEIQRYLTERYEPPTEAAWAIYQANGRREHFYRYLFRIEQQPPEKISP